MSPEKQTIPAVRAGDLDGLGRVYSEWGGLIPAHGEQLLRTAENWEMDVKSPWRSVMPGMIFVGFMGPISSRLHITSERIVLIREIDVFRELRDQMTPLGLPKAAETEAILRRKKAAGAREYCVLRPAALRISRVKRHGKPSRALDLYLIDADSRQYAVSVWKVVGADPDTISLIESRFARYSGSE